MLKICVFFEGSIDYNDLKEMPLPEFNEIVIGANAIQKIRDAETKKASR